MSSRRSPVSLAMALVLCTLPLAAPVEAGDGRIEINQARALAGGVTAIDAPGFPVTLGAMGSYVLTGDLVPGSDVSAIEIRASNVTLDLNGFTLRGPGIGGGSAGGIVSFQQFAVESSIRNGSVRGFRGRGIDLESVSRVHVDDVLAVGNAGGGIALGERSLLTRCRALENGGFGLRLAASAAFSDCVVAGTTGGPAVIGGVQTSGSFCDDGSCTRVPRRRFYLTQGEFAANSVLSACAPGFHTASIFEIHDVTQLRYDTSRGRTLADSGLGPPSSGDLGISGPALAWGRARSGTAAEAASNSRAPNCNAWTSTLPSDLGYIYGLFARSRESLPADQDVALSPWDSSVRNCAFVLPVWCVED